MHVTTERPAACPACGNAALSLNPFLDLLACDGDTGFARCTWSGPSTAVARTPTWIVSKKCAGKKSPLKSGYVHPGFGIAAVPELVYPGSKPTAAAAAAVGQKKRKAAGSDNGRMGADAAAGRGAASSSTSTADAADLAAGGGGGAAAAASAAADATDVAIGEELDSMAFFLQGRFNGGRGPLMATIKTGGGSIALVAATATHILVSDASAAKPEPSKPLARLMATEEGAPLPVVAVAFVYTLLARDPAAGGIALRTPAGLAASGCLLFGSDAGSALPLSHHDGTGAGTGTDTGTGSGSGGGSAKRAKTTSTGGRKFAPAELEVDLEAGYVLGANIVKTDCGSDVYNVMLNKYVALMTHSLRFRLNRDH